MQPNPNPTTEQREGVSIIEELKAAGEELKRAEGEPERQASSSKAQIGQVLSEEGKGWVSLESYQKAITSEKQRLRKAHKKIEGLEKAVRERLEALEKMEGQTEKINTTLKELGQKIVSIKKEDDTLLYQIKETLGEK